MKLSSVLFVSVVLLLGCGPRVEADNTIDYQISDNRYAVVVPEDGISSGEAKDRAMQHAAELAKDKGYKYFTVDSESEVGMIQSKRNSNNEPTNLYYEEIQSGNFGKERLDEPTSVSETPMQGYRLEISLYNEKTSRKAIDVCEFTSCD